MFFQIFLSHRAPSVVPFLVFWLIILFACVGMLWGLPRAAKVTDGKRFFNFAFALVGVPMILSLTADIFECASWIVDGLFLLEICNAGYIRGIVCYYNRRFISYDMHLAVGRLIMLAGGVDLYLIASTLREEASNLREASDL